MKFSCGSAKFRQLFPLHWGISVSKDRNDSDGFPCFAQVKTKQIWKAHVSSLVSIAIKRNVLIHYSALTVLVPYVNGSDLYLVDLRCTVILYDIYMREYSYQ